MNTESEFRAAQTGAVIVNRNVEGRVRVVGRDRLDLLQRMSTNELNSLPVGEARQTVLTTAVARIVDAPWVLNRGGEVLMLTGPGRATAVRRWLAGYIFFRDEIKLEDASAEFSQFALFGKEAASAAEAVMAGSGTLAHNHFIERDGVLVLRGRPLAGDGFHLVMPAAQFEPLWARAVASGAVAASEETYQLLRLAAGVPEAGHELTEDYIPLETDLWDAVSFTKGCYIGQEIIARMESRGKLARRLSGIVLDAPVAVGAEVRAGESVVGTVTSAGVLPTIGPAALSVIKTGACEAGTEVTVGEVRGRVVALPFINGVNG